MLVGREWALLLALLEFYPLPTYCNLPLLWNFPLDFEQPQLCLHICIKKDDKTRALSSS